MHICRCGRFKAVQFWSRIEYNFPEKWLLYKQFSLEYTEKLKIGLSDFVRCF